MLKVGDWVRIRPESKWPYDQIGVLEAISSTTQHSFGDHLHTFFYFRVRFNELRQKYQEHDLIPLSEDAHAVWVLGEEFFG